MKKRDFAIFVFGWVAVMGVLISFKNIDRQEPPSLPVLGVSEACFFSVRIQSPDLFTLSVTSADHHTARSVAAPTAKDDLQQMGRELGCAVLLEKVTPS